MSCYHPLYMIDCGLKENGKRKMIFASSISSNRGLSADELHSRYGDRLVPVPCGHCIGCSLDRSKEWATRCVLESLSYDKNCFITLTYDEAHCPSRLRKRDLQLFLKRFRKSLPGVEIRYFGCGEYGSKGGRPHYHLIIFGYDFDDKVLLSDDGISVLYRSDHLEKLWPFGISSVGELTFESCAYVARYSTKKMSTSRGDEFLVMSRRPGLGSRWFDNHDQLIYLTDKIYSNFGSSHIAKVPRYFDKLADDRGFDLSAVKENRLRIAGIFNSFNRHHYNCYDEIELNGVLEELLAARILTLRRRLS